MATFSFEEAVGQPAGGEEEKKILKPFVPAKRTALRQDRLSSAPAGDGVNYIDTLKALGAKYEGTVVTSLKRTPEHNRRVGGKSNSQHLRGTAGDFVVPPKHRSAFIKDAESQGFTVIDEGDHFHVQRARNGKRGTQVVTPESATVTGSSDEGPKQPVGNKKFSFEAAWGGKAPTQEAVQTSTEPAETEVSGLDFIMQGVEKGIDVLADKGERAFNFIMARINDKPNTYAGRELKYLERTPEEIDRLIKDEIESGAAPTLGREGWEANRRQQLRFQKAAIPTVEDEAAGINARTKAMEPLKDGFWDNIENPAKLLTEDSLPANFLEMITNSGDQAYQNFMAARKVTMQENIVAHPEKYPAVAVEAAKQAIAARKAKQKPGVAEMWSDLKKAAVENPKRFSAQLMNAIVADPEMLLAPAGLGSKVIQSTRAITTGATTTSRVARIADKVIDAGTTGAALNLGIEAAHAGSSADAEMTSESAAMSAGMGFVLSGTLGGLLGKGAKGKTQLKNGEVNADTLNTILRDAAKEELAADDILKTTSPINRSVKHQIEEATGIKFESDADLKAYLQTSRKEWKQLFAERDLNGQYQEALADERIARRQTIAEDAAQREAAGVADEAKRSSVEAAYAQRQAERTTRLAQEYDEALKAREAAKQGEMEDAAIAENNLREATKQLDEQEIFEAAFEGDVPAIRNAMQRAARRDSQLARPKWQRGSVDERVLMRLGAASLFAGTAFALAPEEQKLKSAFGAGLTGLLLPGIGGSVRTVGRRMREAGVISAEGDIVGLLASQGKLKPTRTVEEIKVRDAGLVERVKQGDQQAFKTIFDEYYPEVKRFVRNLTRESGPRLGIDADDIAQEAFLKAYKNMDQFRGDAALSTWLKGIARNEGLMAVRQAKNLREGGEFVFESSELPGVRDAYGESYSRDAFDEGVGAHMEDTPEAQLNRQQVQQQLSEAIEKLPENQKQAFILNRIEQYTLQEMSDMLKAPVSTLHERIKMADEAITRTLAKMNNARRMVARDPIGEVSGQVVKRGRGRPPGSKNKQAGFADEKLMKVLGAGAVGALLGGYMGDKNKKISALAGAGIGILLFGGAKHAVRFADDLYGASSTRILNRSKAIHKRILTTERRILENTHKHIEQVEPFILALSKVPKETADVVSRALMTGRADVIDRLFKAIGSDELTAAYKGVRSTLDSLGDRLVNLKRFKRGNMEYFPRVVKDKEGLFKAIGKQESDSIQIALQEANAESIRKNGRPMSEIEESALINQMLFADKRGVQPGFTKNRGIEEITPELQQYYATPAESLHSYIRSAVQDIEAADFFGDAKRNMQKGGQEFIDVDRSVKNLLADEIKSGALSTEDAHTISEILRARFKEGLRSENELIRNFKNLGNIGLLGNLWSAATQLADVGVQVHVQGLKPTIESVVRQLTGKKLVDMRDFGLADNISQEFAGELRTSKWVREAFKYTLFAGADKFGKNTALNAAVIRAKNLVQTDAGVAKLANKYADAFGPDFPKLVSELRAGKISDLTRDYAFMELSRTQPVSRIEMPLAYLKHPNVRSYLWLKSFTMKQMDLVRRDAYNEIKAGRVAKGVYNLAKIGVVLGISGATTDQIKDWMKGKDTSITWSDIPENMFKTFGFSEYAREDITGITKEEAAERRAAGEKWVRAKDAAPVSALASTLFAPPFKMFDQLLNGDPKAIRYMVPGIGPYLAEKFKQSEQLKREAASE